MDDTGTESVDEGFRVLVLNRLWQPANIIGVRRAVALLFQDHAQVVHSERGQFEMVAAEEWIRLGDEKNFPIAPVNSPKTIVDDPQFKDRFEIYPHEEHGADMLSFPVQFVGQKLPVPSRAPTPGEHNDDVLSNVLGYDADKIASLREDGALGEGR